MNFRTGQSRVDRTTGFSSAAKLSSVGLRLNASKSESSPGLFHFWIQICCTMTRQLGHGGNGYYYSNSNSFEFDFEKAQEAFNRNPTNDSFAELENRLTALREFELL